MIAWWVPYLGEVVTRHEHCWYWFARIQSEVFGLADLPSFSHMASDDSAAVSLLFLHHSERRRWRRLGADERPIDGDAVYVQHGDEPLHIGVWAAAANGVVHAPPGELGVVLSTLYDLRLSGIQHLIFYRRRVGHQ
ncbi:MAG: hypothetical protein KDH20_10975 [Rhodocyclaceae bacterium]|nr:hypothetical protein [Gammaproteobacteria bacterium]MCB1888117.1 hypothetical protein [Rhodocyclaceae bacterium]